MTPKGNVRPGVTTPSGASYEVAYTEAMVKQAVRLFVWRRIFVEQKRLWIGELLVLAGFVALLVSGDGSWYV